MKIAIEKFWCVKYYKAQPYNMEHTLCVCVYFGIRVLCVRPLIPDKINEQSPALTGQSAALTEQSAALTGQSATLTEQSAALTEQSAATPALANIL